MEAISNMANDADNPSRKVVVAGAQLGPIHVSSTRSETLDRMLILMDAAHSQNVKIMVYPEIAFVTFFPRHLITNEQDLETYFERDIDGDPTRAPGMKPLFDRARQYGMDVSVGYAECDSSVPGSEHAHYNTAVYYSAATDKVVSKYRKIHLPGTFEPYERKDATNQLEKRYFRPGDLGFQSFQSAGPCATHFDQGLSSRESGRHSRPRGSNYGHDDMQ